MAKFYGKIGYSFTGETVPGVWVDDFYEKDVVGDWLKNTRQLVNANQVNDNITVNGVTHPLPPNTPIIINNTS